MVPASETVSEKRRDPLGVAKVYANDEKLQVHDDGDGSNPVLPGKGECCPVEDNGGHGGRDLIHALREAVCGKAKRKGERKAGEMKVKLPAG